MKTYKRHRTLDEVQKLCDEQGVELRRQLYDDGGDFVSLHGPDTMVLYSPNFGRFLGEHQGMYFTSNRDHPEAWYQALLNFFYTDEDPK